MVAIQHSYHAAAGGVGFGSKSTHPAQSVPAKASARKPPPPRRGARVESLSTEPLSNGTGGVYRTLRTDRSSQPKARQDLAVSGNYRKTRASHEESKHSSSYGMRLPVVNTTTRAPISLRGISRRSLGILEEDKDLDYNEGATSMCEFWLALCRPNYDELFPQQIEDDSATEELDDLSLNEYPVDLKQEPRAVLRGCPRILTSAMIQQLIDEALPVSLRTCRWDRIYALGRDGDAFITMLDRCSEYKDTIVVLQTSTGHILGGYAAAPWDKQKGYAGSRHFYGNGESFLFAEHPVGLTEKASDDDDEQPKRLHIYKWAGCNLYSQICGMDDGQLAMGGGGSFGLVVQDNFACGSTGPCSTFGNPALIPDSGGTFQVAALEVYGFASLAKAATPIVSPPRSKDSIVAEDDLHGGSFEEIS